MKKLIVIAVLVCGLAANAQSVSVGPGGDTLEVRQGTNSMVVTKARLVEVEKAIVKRLEELESEAKQLAKALQEVKTYQHLAEQFGVKDKPVDAEEPKVAPVSK